MAQSESMGKLKSVRDVFDGLSFSQVTAGALAAVTSMLLASNVGIAGTVIGVAVSSVVSAVASQIYKKFLIASAEKVKDLAPVNFVPGADSAQSEQDAGPASVEAVGIGRDAAPYRAKAPAEVQYPGRSSRLFRARARLRGVTVGDVYANAALARARAARERKAKMQRGVIVVAVLSAIVAVAVWALTVDVFTQGRGLGPQMPTYARSVQVVEEGQEEGVQEDDASGKEEADSQKDDDSSVKGDGQKDEQGKPPAASKPGLSNGSVGAPGFSGGQQVVSPDVEEGPSSGAEDSQPVDSTGSSSEGVPSQDVASSS